VSILADQDDACYPGDSSDRWTDNALQNFAHGFMGICQEVGTRCFGVREPLPQTLLHPSVSPWSAFDLDLCASKSYDAASVAASLERTIGCNTTSKR
jgi:hypothetical protein